MDDDDIAGFFSDEEPQAVAPVVASPVRASSPARPMPPVGKSASSSSKAKAPANIVDADAVFASGGKKADVVHKLRNQGLSKDDGPTRAKSAYMLFQAELSRDGFKGSIKKVAAKWRLLSAEDRKKYEDLAVDEKTRFQTEVKKFYGDRGQDLMSILVECATDNVSKRKVDKAEPKRVPKRSSDDAFGDLFDIGDDAPSSSTAHAAIAAPQLRLDASGKIIVDAASLEAGRAQAGISAAMRTNDAKPYDHAYKRTKRAVWSEEETERFWSAISVYGTDQLLIQTLIGGKTSAQIKAKFKHEEKLNRPKMDEYIYGKNRKKFTKDLFEEHFGKIDVSKHFVPNAPICEELDPIPVVEAIPEDTNAGFDALLDLFD